MNQAQQPEALRLADELIEPIEGFAEPTTLEAAAAAELRRLHARVQELEAQRKPLTEEQIEGLPIWANFVGLWLESRKEIVRDIERAHGITAQPEYHVDEERDHSEEDAAIAAGKVQAAVQGRVG